MMDRREHSVAWMRIIRRAAYPGVVTLLVLLPGLVSADEPWTGGPGLRLLESTASSAATSGAGQRVVALTPGSVLLAQAGVSATDASPGGWQFTIAPYLWAPRTEIDLTVGPLTRSTTIDFFDDIVDNLDLGFSGHFEATWREWTGLLDLLYLKVGKDETTGAGIPTDLDYEQLFFEFGGTYRFATLPVGRTGRITLEALAGGRLMYVDTELAIGAQSRSRSTTLIDPMFGGRIAYHITDTVALWFRGDVAGFGISDSQSELTYNVIAGVNWRFTRVASAFMGWRYMHVDIEKDSGLGRLDTDVSFNGPFLGVNFYF
jgi:hypothetical protein